MNSKWTFNNLEFSEDMIGDNYGFVYIITNNTSNKKYIGKKFFYSSKQRQVKGKKKKYKAESDWITYYGSNEQLTKDVQELGMESFNREILKLCKTKGECSYYEAKYQFQDDCILKPDSFYNSWIMCRIHRKHMMVDLK